MKDQLVSLETARLAKEKGFDARCFATYKHFPDYSKCKLYDPRGSRLEAHVDFRERNWNNGRFNTSAPTQSLLQKWLREVYRIYVEVNFISDICIYFVINQLNEDLECILEVDSSDSETVNAKYDNWEKALEDGLIYALKLIE